MSSSISDGIFESATPHLAPQQPSNLSNEREDQDFSLESEWDISFGIPWASLPHNIKQTVYPMYNHEGKIHPCKSPIPNLRIAGIRVTKGVNMCPCFVLQIVSKTNRRPVPDTTVRLSLVSALTRQTPPVHSCSCKGHPLLTESTPWRIWKDKRNNDWSYAMVKNGIMELAKLQIGCCTGSRGHNVPFLLKVEFIDPYCPLYGLILYSLPMEVGTKNPFADTTLLKGERNFESLIILLREKGFEEYVVQKFIDHEIDLETFASLNNALLMQMGFDTVGLRIKLLKEVQILKGKGFGFQLDPYLFSENELLGNTGDDLTAVTHTFDINGLFDRSDSSSDEVLVEGIQRGQSS